MTYQVNPRKKQKVFERDGFKCVICGISGDFATLEVGHIIPYKQSQDSSMSNLQTECYKCNMKKRWGKYIEDNEKDKINISPIERLSIIKERLESYKGLSWSEFKILFTQDIFFRRFKLGLEDVKDYFHEMNGINTDIGSSDTMISRDCCVRYIMDNFPSLSQEEVARIAKVSTRTIRRIKERTRGLTFD